MKAPSIIVFLLLMLTIISCKTLQEGWDNLNLFPVSQDVALGKQVYFEIDSNEVQYPEVPEQGNEELYKYVRNIVHKILKTGLVEYSNDFPWTVTILNDTSTLNAFATPGGYIYLYTGLIRFLDSEDQLAGVLGHEIAHAAKRHSTKQLSKLLGVQILADASLGNKELVKQVATTLLALSFSRAHETQADSMSVVYLCPTEYNAAGASGFFHKIEGQPTPPSWLSTHPNPNNRIQNIENKNKSLGCKGQARNITEYARIKKLVERIPSPKAGNPDPKQTQTPKPANSEDKRLKKIEKPGGK